MGSHTTTPVGPLGEALVEGGATRALRTTVQGPLREGRVDTADVPSAMEVLADQAGNGNVTTFTFSEPVDIAWVRCTGGSGRASGAGAADPAVNRGAVCAEDEPEPITVHGDTVRVFAAPEVTIAVWGYRY